MKITKLLATLALVLPVMSHAGGWYAGLDAGSATSDARVNEYVFLGDTAARGTDTSVGWRLCAAAINSAGSLRCRGRLRRLR